MLSARDVEEALKERLLRGAYPRGGALPSVRALAAATVIISVSL